MDSLKGKKLLILAGIATQAKIVKAAKALGVYTIVTDYNAPDVSPAKKAADEYWMISYGDTEKLAEQCEQRGVDGVLTCYHESAQIPYFRLCQRLGLPCYADLDQFEKLTNKREFKKLCRLMDIGVIPEYSVEDAMSGRVEFPVMVKPSDRCGSKGQSICSNEDELKTAIRVAEKESLSGDIIIEKYLANKNSFQVTYFFADGEAYLVRTTDGYKGSIEQDLDRVALCSVSPSVFTGEYLKTTNEKFVKMLRSIGIKDGPVMAQGFYDDGVFRFYDPGRRFPGTDFEIVYKELFGIDLMQAMVVYALTGKMPLMDLKNENVYLRGNRAVVLFPTLRTGTIGRIEGFSKLSADPRIRNIQQKHPVGATLDQPNTVAQRIFEVDFVSPSMDDAKDLIRGIQDTISVLDENGASMIDHPFDVDRLGTAASQR